jgi:hypothetical protein
VLSAALLALALAADGCGLPPPTPGASPFTTGETASYDLDLFGLVRAGALELSAERPSAVGAGRIVPLRARARTDPSVANLLRLAALAFSWVDTRTLLPERYREEADENGVHKVSDTRLAPPAADVELSFDIAGAKGAARYPREGTALDAVSAVWYLSAARLSAGDRMCFDLVARGRVWRVQGVVAPKHERIDTVLGKVETLRIDARATLADRPQDPPRQMHVWLTTEVPRRVLVAVGEVDLGPVKVTLTGVRGGKR